MSLKAKIETVSMASGSMTTISSSHSTTLTESVLKLITGKPRDCRLIYFRPPDLISDEPGKLRIKPNNIENNVLIRIQGASRANSHSGQ